MMFWTWISTLLFLIAACTHGTDPRACTHGTDPRELRIILVGKTGSGKSTSGNVILGEKVFKTAVSAESVTQKCEKAKREVEGRSVTVVDTPGLFDTSKSNEELRKDIKECVVVQSVPGPHAILLVINVKARFTEEEKAAVKWIQDNFGPDASMYTILLFTHTNLMEGKSLDKYISESKDLRRLTDVCGGRYHAFNKDLTDRSQVTELLKTIDNMVQGNGGQHYTNDMYEEAQRKLEEERKRAEEEQRRKKEEEEQRWKEEVEKKKRHEKRMSYCKIMAALSAGLVGGGLFFSSYAALGLGTVLGASQDWVCVFGESETE